MECIGAFDPIPPDIYMAESVDSHRKFLRSFGQITVGGNTCLPFRKRSEYRALFVGQLANGGLRAEGGLPRLSFWGLPALRIEG